MFKLPAGRIPSLLTRSRHLRPRITSRSLGLQVRNKVTLTETIHIRFQESSQVRRRIFQAFVYIAAFYVFQRVVLGPLDDIDLPEEDTKGARKKQKSKPTPDEVLNGTDEEEDEDDALFIPLGWTTELPRQWYKGSDPEWQDFRKLSQDKGKNNAIRLQLVSKVRSQYAGHHQVKHLCGSVNVNAGKYWIELQYPEGPPKEYSRSGIEITDDVIAWTTRPVSERNHQRLNRALYPWATVQSIYATSAVLMKVTWHDMQAYLGLNPKPDVEIVRVKRLQAAIAAHQRLHHGSGNGSELPTSTATASSLQPQSMDKSSTMEGPKTIVGLLPHPSSLVNTGLPPFMTSSVTLGRLLFMHNLTNNRAWAVNVHPPRGSVVLSGLIEVVGQKGRLTVDVTAAYDVKEGKFIEMHSSPKRFLPHRQSPRGGP